MREPDGICRILVSYWYYRKRDLAALAGQTKLPVQLFADSGAFTAFTMRGSGAVIRREEYAAWLKHWWPLLSVAVNLDVIGDSAGSARNQLWLEGQGLPVLPVYHMQTPLAELHALCRDYRYVAVGGTANLKGANKLAATARAMLIAREHGTRIHGLGRSASAELAALPFWSVDSSSWSQASRFGGLAVFEDGKVRSLRVQDAVGRPQLLRAHGADPQLMRDAAYANTGRKWGRVKTQQAYDRERHESLRVAAVAWKRMEAYLQQRHAVPAPPGLEGDGTTMWFVDAVPERLHQMMRAVEWLADRPGASTRKGER